MARTPTLIHAAQQANTTDAGNGGDDQTGIRLVTLADGNIVALWTSNTDTGAGSAAGTDIIGQLFDPGGNKIGGEFTANTMFFVQDERDVAAAALPNGNFVVAFERGDGTDFSLRYEIRDPTGTFVKGGSIALPSTHELGGAAIAVNAEGGFMVTYQDRDPGANTTTTKGTIVTEGGVAGLSFNVLSGGSTDVGANGQQTDIAVLTNSHYVIVDHSNGTDQTIRMRILDASGGSVLGNTPVGGTDSNTETDFNPTVAALTGGGFVVAWANTDSNDTDIEFQRYTDAGVAVGGKPTVNGGGATDNNITPHAVGLSDGGFVIAYDDNEANTITLQRYSDIGGKVGTEIVVATGGVKLAPDIALSSDGRLLVGWGTSVFAGGLNFDNDVSFAVYDTRENQHDVGGDGFSDLVYQQASSGQVLIAQLNGGHQPVPSAFNDAQLGSGFAVVSTTSDFNGDGKADILWRDKASGATVLTFQDGSHQPQPSGYTDVQLGLDWSVRTGDFDGNGKADLLYQNLTSGQTIVSLMNGTQQTVPSAFTDAQLGAGFAVAAVADFNGDGKADILYRDKTSGATAITFQDGAHQAQASGYTDVQLGLDWTVQAADFNGDGKADLLSRNVGSGATIVAALDGTHQPVPSAFTDVQLGNQYEIAQLSDFNGDGKADILFRDASSGSTFIAFQNGAHAAAPSAYTDVQIDHSWLIV